MSDCAIIGGGIIGLSIANELALRGWRVSVFESQRAHFRSTSWAAAGIIPSHNSRAAHDTYGKLCGLSVEGYEDWTSQLASDTGIDPEFTRCGGIQLARTAGEAVALASNIGMWQHDGSHVEKVDAKELTEREPALRELVDQQRVRSAYWIPGEAHVRCSRLIDALRESCRQRGVELCYGTMVQTIERHGDRATALVTSQGTRHLEHLCVTTGSWTDRLLRSLDVGLDIQPWRGQIVLLQSVPNLLQTIINEGPNYLVGRRDGKIVVGATVEDVGYDWQTTSAVDSLHRLAVDLVPALANAPRVDAWSGLRPRTADGFPYLGRIPGLQNGFVAAGHFRSGIVMAPMTARVMSDLLCGSATIVDLAPFRVDR